MKIDMGTKNFTGKVLPENFTGKVSHQNFTGKTSNRPALNRLIFGLSEDFSNGAPQFFANLLNSLQASAYFCVFKFPYARLGEP